MSTSSMPAHLSINVDGVSSGVSLSYETFRDFYADPSKISEQGYVASLQDPSNSVYHLYDDTGDGIPDRMTGIWTDPVNGSVTTSVTLTWDANNMFTAVETTKAGGGNVHYGRLAFDSAGQAVGMYVFDLTPVALTPDTNPDDKLVASFTMPGSNSMSLYDQNGDGTIDRMETVLSFKDLNGNVQSGNFIYQLNWSDTIHWTANAVQDYTFGTVYDQQGRPLTIFVYGAERTIVWQAKGADSVVATINFSFSYNGASIPVLMQLLDTTGDSTPDQVIWTQGIQGTAAYLSMTASLEGWKYDGSQQPTAVTAVIQTSSEPAFILNFSGVFAGPASNPTTILLPSYLSGGSTDTTAPTVTTFSPADAATDVAVGSNIVLSFSEAIQKGAGTIQIHSGSATGTVVESYEVSTNTTNLTISGSTLTINPTVDLSGGTHYYVTIAAGSIKDMAGNSFTGTSTYDFTTASMSTMVLKPTKNAVDLFFISSSQGGTLYDADGNGVIDHMRVGGQVSLVTNYYSLNWSDSTHWTAKGVVTFAVGTQYDSQNRPVTAFVNGAELPINWAGTVGADHVLFTVTQVNGTLTQVWKGIDTNGDNILDQGDQGTFTATITGGPSIYILQSTIVSSTTDSIGHLTSFTSEIQTSTNANDVFSGSVTGSNTLATAIQLPSSGTGSYTLLPAGKLLDSFTLSSSVAGRLYDMDGNGVIDQMDIVSTTTNLAGQTSTSSKNYQLTWSDDSTHWTAHIMHSLSFGSTYDVSGRPTTVFMNGTELPIDWATTVTNGVLGTVTTASGSVTGVMTFIDSNSDGKPDQGSLTDTSGYSGYGDLVGWIDNPTEVTVLVQTSTNASEVFTGSVTGTGSYATDIQLPSFLAGSASGTSSLTLVSTKHQVDVFSISATQVGRLYDMDSNGVVDRMDVQSTSTDQSGMPHTTIDSYALTWSDSTHWTAYSAQKLLLGSTYDGSGRPTTVFMNGGEQAITWQVKGADNVVATVSSVYGGISAQLTLVDTNGDNNPDAFDYTEGSGATLMTAKGSLDWWVTDSLDHPLAVTAVVQSSLNAGANSFSGSVTGSSSNPTAIIMPSMSSNTGGGTTTTDSLLNNVLSFNTGIQSPVLAATGQITVTDAGMNGQMTSVTLDVSKLSLNGSLLKVPTTGTDVNGTPYTLSFSGGNKLLVNLSDGIVGQSGPLAKAWQVNTMSDGSYTLSPMTVVSTTGTSGMDWVTGTSGNDSITAGAGSDFIQLSGGNDTVDAGDGYDTVNLPMSGTSAYTKLDSQGVLHIMPIFGSSWSTMDAYRITRQAGSSLQIQKVGTDGLTVESTMLLSNAESIAFNGQSRQLQVSYGNGQYVSGTPWDDQISLNSTSIANLVQVWGDTGRDTLVFDVGSGYSKLDVVRNGASYVLKGTDTVSGSVVELGHTTLSANGYGTTMTVGSKSFIVNDIEAFRFVSGQVTRDFAPDSLSNNTLSFDAGIQSPVLAATGHLTIKAVTSYAGLTSVTLDVSKVSVDGSHLTVPMSGTDASGVSYYLSAYSGIKLFVDIPDALVVGQPAQAHAWQVGNMINNSYTLSPINVVSTSGTPYMDWVTGTSGSDSINAGAGDDYIQWSGGNDTVDAGDGSDTLQLPVTTTMVSRLLDSNGVLHLSSGYSSMGSSTAEDLVRITKQPSGSMLIEKMAAGGTTVESTMLLSNAETLAFGYQTIQLVPGSSGSSPYISGTPWDDVISLSASSVANISSISGDTGHDTLSFDVGAGYSKLEIVKQGGANHLMGTPAAGGTAVDLGSFVPSSYGMGQSTLTVGTGAGAKTLSLSSIEAFHFVSGTVTLDVDPSQYLDVTFTSYSSSNTIYGTANADTIDADALGQANSATTTNDYITGNAGNDSIKAGAGDDSITGGAGNDTIDGGTGTDTAIYTGNFTDYTITYNSSTSTYYTVTDTVAGRDGTDTLTNIEYLQFNGVTKTALELVTVSPVDTTPPVVVNFRPAPASKGIAVDSTMVLTFSESIQKGSGTIAIHSGTPDGTTLESYDAATDTMHLNFSGTTLTIDPTATLATGIHYVVTFADGAVKDMAGNSYVGSAAYGFTTAYTQKPAVAIENEISGSGMHSDPAGSGMEYTLPTYGGVRVISDYISTVAGKSWDTQLRDFSDNLGTGVAESKVFQKGIADYVAATGLSSAVMVRNISFSSDTTFTGLDPVIINGTTASKEALVIDVRNLSVDNLNPTHITLDDVDFAVVVGPAYIRGGAGSNVVYADDSAQNIVLGAADDTLHGGGGNDYIGSLDGNDVLYGDAGNDTLSGGAGNDTIDGGTDTDTVLYTGNFADYTITYNSSASTYTVTDNVSGRDGTDTLTNIEYLQFNDVVKTVADSVTTSAVVMSTFTLTPTKNTVDQFVISSSQTGRLYDVDGNGVIDHLRVESTSTTGSGQVSTSSSYYKLDWSDTTHWTAKLQYTYAFGKEYDLSGRPMTIFVNGNELPFNYASTVTGGVLATVSQVNGSVSGLWKIIDSNNDGVADQTVYTETTDGVETYSAHANVSGWLYDSSNHPTAVTMVMQTSTNQSEVFSGTVTGSSSQATAVQRSGDSSSITLISTKNQVDVFTIAGGVSGRLYDIDKNGAIDQMDIVGTTFDQSGWASTTIKSYALFWSDSTHWTASANGSAEVFSGSVTGSNIHATDIQLPSLSGGNGTSYTLVSTQKQVDTFRISTTETGRLYDMDSNGTIDRLDVVTTNTDKSGQASTSINSYALSWSIDGTHWTANGAHELLFGSTYDGTGRPTSIVMNGGEQAINWATGANGVLATVSSMNGTVSATLTFVDTNNDSAPDAFDYTEGTGTAHGSLDWWVTDSLNHPLAVTVVIQTSSNLGENSFSGSMISGANNLPSAIELPSLISNNGGGTTNTDSLQNNTLSFDTGIQSPVLAGSGRVTVTDVTSWGGQMTSVTLDVSSLSLNGSLLKVPMSGDDVNGNSYTFAFSGGSKLLVDLPAGIVGQSGSLAKAWQVNTMSDGSYTLSSMTVVSTTGTAGMDWVTGTSGNDSITAGAGSDFIQWSGGNDTVDAGDGYDTVNLPMSGTSAYTQFDSQGVLHVYDTVTSASGYPTSKDAYRITRQADSSLQIQKVGTDGSTLESTMLLSNAESIAFSSQSHQMQVSYGNGQYVTGTPWDDVISLNAADVANLVQVWGDTGTDTLVSDVGAGYSKLDVVRNGASYVLKGTDIGGNVVELGHTTPSANGYGTTMTIGTKSFIVNDIEAFRFVSGSVTRDFVPDSLSNNTLSFDAGVELPVLAATGHQITVKVLASYGGGLTTATFDVSELSVDGSHLTVPMSGSHADGTWYSLNPYNGGKLLVDIPDGLVVGQPAQAYAWQVGNMINNSYTLSPMSVVATEGTSDMDWVTGTSGNDSISAGAGDDFIQWSGGTDTVDAGDGHDTVQLPLTSMEVSRQLDRDGVLHLSSGYSSMGSSTAEDLIRITKQPTGSMLIEKMAAGGTTVESSMLLSNAEALVAGYQTIQLVPGSSGSGSYINGTPWDDVISLSASSLLNTYYSIYGDTGHDTLSLDVGAGYSNLEIVKQGGANHLMGTPAAGGTAVDLGSFVPSSYGMGQSTLTVGTGAGAKTLSLSSIEAFHFVSGTVTLDVDPSQYLDVTFTGSSYSNTINGTSNADTIDADALGLANSATTTNDYIYGNGGNDSIKAGAGDDYITGGAGNDTIDGGAGNDTVSYYGYKADYTVTSSNGVWTVTDNRTDSPDGTDTITGIEHFSFSDGTLDLVPQYSPAYYSGVSNTITGSSFDDVIDADALGTANSAPTVNDSITGNGGNDSINAGMGDDYITGGAGNDTIDGGAGNDTARYSGNMADYTLINTNGVWTVTDNRTDSPDGTDTLTGIEHLSFSDGTLDMVVQFTPTYYMEGGNTITGSSMDDHIDADALAAANPWKGSEWHYVYLYGNTTTYTLGSYDFSNSSGTVIFTDQELAALATSGLELLHGTDKVQSALTVSATDIINQAGGAYTLHWIGTATQSQVPYYSSFQVDREVVNSYNDSITGNAGSDVIDAGTGHDTVFGGAGNDTITGGVADDYITGGAGNDSIDGGAGNDIASYAGKMADYTMSNHDGVWTVTDNRTDSPDGTDTLTDIEHLSFSDGTLDLAVQFTPAYNAGYSNIITGSGFDDAIDADALGTANLAPTTNDYITGQGGNDSISAGAGNDVIYGGAGNDTIDGGAGNDTASYNGLRSDYTVINASGIWSVTDNRQDSPNGTDTVTGVEHFSFQDGVLNLDIEYTPAPYSWSYNMITGSGLPDQIDAEALAAANPWKGSEWHYVYFNGATTYTLGSSEFSNSNGTVTFTGQELAALAMLGIELLHGGAKVNAGFTVSAADIVNQTDGAYELHWVGTEAQPQVPYWNIGYQFDREVVNSHNDSITGNEGNDSINAGEGNDTVNGGAGFDLIDGGAGNDTVVYYGYSTEYTMSNDNGVWTVADNRTGSPDGTDMVTGVEHLSFYDRVVDLTIQYTPADNAWYSSNTITGTGFDDAIDADVLGQANSAPTTHDIITGNGGNDSINAGAGDDSVNGGAGDDSMSGGSGNDTIDGGDGHDTALFSGQLAEYVISYDPLSGRHIVADSVPGRDGTDAVSSVEYLRFADVTKTLPPVITSLTLSSDTGISSSDFVTSMELQTISGTLSAATTPGEVVRVSLDNGLTWHQADNTIGEDSFSYTGTLTGSDTLQVRVEDADGTQGVIRSQPYVLDTTIPSIVSHKPMEASSGVQVGSNLEITFSEQIQKGTGTIVIHSGSADGPVFESFDAASSQNVYLPGGSTLIINPDKELSNNTHYFITLTEDVVHDQAGHSSSAVVAFDFTTDLPSPFSHYTGADPSVLVNALMAPDSGISVSNVVLHASGVNAVNYYDGSRPALEIGAGLLLTTGITPGTINTSTSFGLNNGVAGDADIDAVVNTVFATSSYDATTLEFDFTVSNPAATSVSFDLVFGSEEYPEWVNAFVDCAVVIVNGVNYALFNHDPMHPLSVIYSNLDAGYFQNNAIDPVSGMSLLPIEYDGVSHMLKIIAPIKTGQATNHIKIGIADTGDHIYDSGLFVAGFSAGNLYGSGVVDHSNDGTTHDDFITGTDKAEYFDLQDGNDTVSAGGGDDIVSGGSGNDLISGDDGADTINGGTGNDTIDGGAGNDTALFSGNFAGYTVSYEVLTSTYTLTDTVGGDGTDMVTGVENFQFADVTKADIIAPNVIGFSPAAASTDIAVGSDIVLTFSEAVKAGTGSIIISDGNGDTRTIAITDSTQVTISGTTLTINPAADLHAGTTYSVQMAGGVITDLAGNAYAGITNPTTLNFFTASNNVIHVNHAPTFVVGNGVVITDMNKSHEFGGVVALQSDGKILLAGTTTTNVDAGNYDFALVRYNTDGGLDTSFGTNGKLWTDMSSSVQNFPQGWNTLDSAGSLAVQSDGRIIVSGTSSWWSGPAVEKDFALAFYNTDGSIGKVHTDFWINNRPADWQAYSTENAHGMTVQADGKIVVVGDRFSNETGSAASNFAVARYNTDGTLDGSFGDGDGLACTHFFDNLSTPDHGIINSQDFGYGVAVQSDGKIIVVGQTYFNEIYNPDFAIARYNADGSLDASFGVNGLVTTDFGSNDSASSVIVESDGKIIVGGISGWDSAIARYNTDGSLDTTFGNAGKLEVAGFQLHSMTMQPDGRIIAAGYGGGSISMVRCNADGSLDTSFGGGMVTTPFSVYSETACYSVVLQSDGKIILSGNTVSSGTSYDFIVMRYNADGTLDTSFGGVNTLNGTVVYVENNAPVVLDSNVRVSDPELATVGNYEGATLTLVRHDGANAQDHFFGAGTLGALVEGGNLVVDGTIVGTVTTNSGGTLELAFNSGATQTLLNAVLDQVAYSHTSGSAVPETQVQIDWIFSDGNTGLQGTGGALSATGSTTVTIAVNHAPTGNVFIAGTITGTTMEGHTLTADSSTLADVDGLPLPNTFSYQWEVDGTPIAGATGSTYIPTHADVGHAITVVTSYADLQGTHESVSSTPTAAVLAADTVLPELTGSTPADASTGVAVGSDIVLTFSEAVKAGTGTIAIHSGSANGAVVESYDAATDTAHLTFSGDTLVINPANDLQHDTHYFVTVDPGAVKDTAGNSYAGTSGYDFTTAAAPSSSTAYDLVSSVKFWKTGAPISGVTETLATSQADAASHPIEFKVVQVGADGSRTIEIWENTSRTDIDSLQIELALPAGTVTTWQDAAGLPSGWTSVPNTTIAGEFILGGYGLAPLSAGQVRLGTLTVSAPSDPSHFELQLTYGALGVDTVPAFGIVSDTSVTGADGMLQYTGLASGGYTLDAAKAVDASVINAVKANDALAALKMAVGLNPNGDGSSVASYQYLAADVNKDGRISAFDALNILKMAVHLPTAPANEWLFVSDSVGNETMTRTSVHWPASTVPVTLDQNMELQLIGIVKGDVNGSWVAA